MVGLSSKYHLPDIFGTDGRTDLERGNLIISPSAIEPRVPRRATIAIGKMKAPTNPNRSTLNLNH